MSTRPTRQTLRVGEASRKHEGCPAQLNSMEQFGISEEDIQRAAELIRSGKLVAFPTETVYGLGANALDARAVARIFEVKGRPSSSPIIVHVSNHEMIGRVAASWPDKARALAKRFWPGPLTLVVPKTSEVPDIVTAGLGTVGVRMPAHPVALALIEAAQVPIAAPSANRFSEVSPTTAEHVRQGTRRPSGLRSRWRVMPGGYRVHRILTSLMKFQCCLRPGGISRQRIEELIGAIARGRPEANRSASCARDAPAPLQPTHSVVSGVRRIGAAARIRRISAGALSA